MLRAFLAGTGLALLTSPFAALSAHATPGVLSADHAANGACETHTSAVTNVPISKEDAAFASDAATGGLLEVRLGEIAVKQAGDDTIKSLAQRMIDDHTKLAAKLNQIAQIKGIALPDNLEKHQEDDVNRLSKFTGPRFDREFAAYMVTEHMRDLRAFEKEAKDGKDVDLKDFAAAAVPTLKEHLTLTEQAQAHLHR